MKTFDQQFNSVFLEKPLPFEQDNSEQEDRYVEALDAQTEQLITLLRRGRSITVEGVQYDFDDVLADAFDADEFKVLCAQLAGDPMNAVQAQEHSRRYRALIAKFTRLLAERLAPKVLAEQLDDSDSFDIAEGF